ncbi:MAG TPA: M48 family metallopeptidase [Usitatibacter sp.]|nr:M48 family metallopeptidase [Usitatibacter sp.]
MKRRDFIVVPGAAIITMQCNTALAAFDIGGAIGAATDAAKAATLSDDEVRKYAAQIAVYSDKQAKIAPAGDKYAQRLTAITAGMTEDQGMRLNYKVYLTKEVNAFAMADGTIRFYSGLMDMMTDDELRYVAGHEMGHVKNGHTKKRMQTALAAGAAQKGVAASGTRAGVLADSQLGNLIVQVVRAQHSQGNEREADDYAMQFMSRRKYDRKACVTALEKLDKMSGGGGGASWLSTHPSPRERADRMRKQVA